MKTIEKYTGLIMEMLSIPAVSRHESRRAAFLASWLQNEGLSVKRVENNLVVTSGTDPSKAVLLLNSHMDTVPAGSDWLSNPDIPVKDKGMITALGSNDAGASVISLIASMIALKEKGMADPLVLVISAEEEVSGNKGIVTVFPMLKAVRFAIVGEPTGMQPAVAERGLMVIDASSRGKAGHAARNEGENAIYKALEDVERIRKLTFHEPSEWLVDPSVNVTMIHAGTGHNVIPDTCDFVIDVRSNDHYPNQRMLDMLRGTCEASLKPRSMRLNSSFLPADHPVFPVFHELDMKPFGSPTLSDMALMEFPAVKIGPGDSSRSHTANEFIMEDEIRHAVDIYTKLIEKAMHRI